MRRSTGVAHGRIRRNERPSYAYVSGNFNVGARRGEHIPSTSFALSSRTGASTSTLPLENVMEHLPPLPTQGVPTIGASRVPVRREFAMDEVTVDNVPYASTLTLLRLRARDVRAKYLTMWRCYANSRVEPFLYESQEGSGAVVDRVKNLQLTIDEHVRLTQSLRVKVDNCADSKRRWKRANRSGGTLARVTAAKHDAVLMELIRREELDILDDNRAVPAAVVCAIAQAEVVESHRGSARAPLGVAEQSGVTNNTAHRESTLEGPRFPVQYVVDNERIERDLDMESSGIAKPSRGDRLITARTLAYERNDIEGARQVQASIDQRQATRRFARRRARTRKAEIRAERKLRDRTSDPHSYDE